MLSILLYYSHFLTLVFLASLWSRKWQLKDFHQSTLVLLCLRISGNVLRITTFALSQWFQSDTGVGSWIPGFIQSGEFKWDVHKCCISEIHTMDWFELFTLEEFHRCMTCLSTWAKAHIWMNTYFPLLPKPPRHSEYQKKKYSLLTTHFQAGCLCQNCFTHL